MDEIQFGQTVASEEEWLHEQDNRQLMDDEDARIAMQEARLERDKQKLLRMIGFDDVFGVNK